VAPERGPRGGAALRLFNFERRWLTAVFAVLIPAGADERMPYGAAQAPMGRFVDELLEHAPLQFVAGLRACLWMVMLSPLFLLGRLRTFLGVEHATQLALLDRFRTSNVYLVRETPLLFKTIGCLGFCGLPAVQQQLGIHPTDAAPPDWARALPLTKDRQ
jgi:hypothetical protein